jgi:hypothetical protein
MWTDGASWYRSQRNPLRGPDCVTYAGSYQLELTKGGLLRNDKGSFSRIDTPHAERQLLELLAKELGASSWASSVNARLAETTNRSWLPYALTCLSPR